MPLPSRPAPMLLLAVLLGASAMAVAAPQHRPHRAGDPGGRPRPEAFRGQSQGQPPQAAPRQQDPFPEPPPESRRHSEDALSDSVRRVEQRTRGQVLSAERVPYDGRNLNRIKVVDQRGRVRVYMDDPQQSSDSPADSAPTDAAPTRDNDD